MKRIWVAIALCGVVAFFAIGHGAIIAHAHGAAQHQTKTGKPILAEGVSVSDFAITIDGMRPGAELLFNIIGHSAAHGDVVPNYTIGGESDYRLAMWSLTDELNIWRVIPATNRNPASDGICRRLAAIFDANMERNCLVKVFELRSFMIDHNIGAQLAFGGFAGDGYDFFGSLCRLSRFPERGTNKQYAYSGDYEEILGPEDHSALSRKVLLGAPLIAIGFWVSVLAFRRRPGRRDDFGLLIFLCGGLIGGVGIALIVQ